MDAIGALLAAGVAPSRGQAAGAAPAGPKDNATAAREMESLFAFELVKAMRRTVPESGLLSGGRGEEIMRSIQDQALAEAVASRGGLGLAKSLLPALNRMSPPVAAATGKDPAASP
jgi:Rod binding domain-containing protein